MDGIFGIGIPEILIVVVLALIILGPQDMVNTARKLGRWIYRVYHSPTWRMIISTSQELRELPTKFVREAGLEEPLEEIKHATANVKAQLKEVTGDVSTEIQGAGSDARAEVQEARQELGAAAQAATAAISEPVEAPRPAEPVPEPGSEPVPGSSLLLDPGEGGNHSPSSAPPVPQPEPFNPRPAQSEPQNPNPEEFTI